MLQVINGKFWGDVCYQDWTSENANVACKHLGYATAEGTHAMVATSRKEIFRYLSFISIFFIRQFILNVFQVLSHIRLEISNCKHSSLIVIRSKSITNHSVLRTGEYS